MATLYDDSFFDWVDSGASVSARKLLPHVKSLVQVDSVVDVGCGRGTWLGHWLQLGVSDVMGIDGAHVDQTRLAIPREQFVVADLSEEWTPPARRFSLSQSLEVGEHLPSQIASHLVQQLCALSDVVMFSAATPGQGGEWHINEQEPAYWAALFRDRGYAMFDGVRTAEITRDVQIEPWYRYNAFIYANAAGEARLSEAARRTKVSPGEAPREVSHFGWRMRRFVLRPLPPTVVTSLSRAKYRAVNALKLRAMGSR